MGGITVRKAEEADAGFIVSCLKKLADYEKLENVCNITPAALSELMKEENGLCAEIAEADGVPAGVMTYYFYKIATFSGKRVMYVEDVFIGGQFRRKGIGTALFEKAKKIASEKSCARLEWKCLDWNASARSFYEKIGGKISSDEWLTYTIDI